MAGTTAFCFAAGVLAALPALAQESGALRGTLSGKPDRAPAIDSASVSSIPSAPYQPASAGAVADATDNSLPSETGEGPASSDAPDTAAASADAEPDETGSTPPAAASGEELRIERIDTREQGRARAADATNVRTGSVDARTRRRDDEPFAPIGLRVGTFNVFPQVEQGVTVTNNADQSPSGGSATLSESTLRLKAVSDWSRNEASVEGYGTLRRTLSGQDVKDFEGGLNSDLTIDISSGLRGLASFDYTLFPEDASSPVSIANVDSRPLHHVIAGSVGVEKAAGKLRLRLTGEVQRDQYGDATLDDGSTLSQADRNATLAALKLRTGYEVSPALTPFVEGEIGRRYYDEQVDAAGYERSANRVAARAGVALDLREKLQGEFSAGWVHEAPDDDRLEAISGPSIATSLIWSPVRETTLRLDGSTIVEGSTTPGETGSILYTALLTAKRQMRADLSGTAALGLGYRRYDVGGHDTLASAELGLTWWMNRYAGVTGRARYELLRSDLADRDYDAASVFLGLTLQR